MSKLEIKKLFYITADRCLPCGLNIIEKLWWRFMPGVVINVRWPKGLVVLDELADGSRVSTESADPNDHYRPWLEEHVGKQGWDWNWGLVDNNVAENRLTIKIRQKHASHAIVAALRWA